jgi:putative effector of murein hydrolase LrgA (UPF0299 family)
MQKIKVLLTLILVFLPLVHTVNEVTDLLDQMVKINQHIIISIFHQSCQNALLAIAISAKQKHNT